MIRYVKNFSGNTMNNGLLLDPLMGQGRQTWRSIRMLISWLWAITGFSFAVWFFICAAWIINMIKIFLLRHPNNNQTAYREVCQTNKSQCVILRNIRTNVKLISKSGNCLHTANLTSNGNRDTIRHSAEYSVPMWLGTFRVQGYYNYIYVYS